MATTTDGWPYVVPADHPLEYPAVSQQLAMKLDGRLHDLGGVAQLSRSVPSDVAGTTSLSINGTPEMWGGVTAGSAPLYTPRAGLYEISLNATFASSTNGTIRQIWVLQTSIDTPPVGYDRIGATSGPAANTTGNGLILSASGYWRIPAGQGVHARGRQDSGAAMTVTGMLTLRFIRD